MPGITLNAAIEIVISLAALFWLLSMTCSFLVEAVNSMVRNIRANLLERFVCEMVLGQGNGGQPWHQAIRTKFSRAAGRLAGDASADPLGILSHGLISSLRKPSIGATSEGTAPSYIPSNTFAKVLLDRLVVLATAGGQGLGACADVLDALGRSSQLSPGWDLSFQQAAKRATATSGLLTLSAELMQQLLAQSPTQATAMLTQLQQALQKAATGATSENQDRKIHHDRVLAHLDCLIAGLIGALGKIPNTTRTIEQIYGSHEAAWMHLLSSAGISSAHAGVVDAVRVVVEHGALPTTLRDALRPIVAHADFDLTQLRQGVEAWFDSVMERATGWFKRHTTLWLGITGLVLTIVLNINPLSIAWDLAKNPDARTAGVAFAQQVVEQGGDAVLAQRLAFEQAAQLKNWEQRIQDLRADKTPMAGDPKALTEEMQFLLLRSGQYWGLLSHVRAPRDGEWSGMDRSAFLNEVCSAWFETQRVTRRMPADAKPPASIVDCPSLNTHFVAQEVLAAKKVTVVTRVDSALAPTPPVSGVSTPATTTTTTDERVMASPGSIPKVKRNDDSAQFWSSSELVWDTRLATALWNVRLALANGTSPDYKTLLEAFQVTRKLNTELSQRTRGFLAQLPSLGWGEWECLCKPLDGWNTVRSKILLGLIGWPLAALMVSFGAPFWFDLLSKLLSRRVTGPRPADGSPST